MQPLLASAPHFTLEGGVLAESLRRTLVPSSVQELDRRGYRQVKVLPREAVSRLVADAAERLLVERLEAALVAERARAEDAVRGEVLFLTEALERARIDLAAAHRAAEAARLEREAALEEAELARLARLEALRHAAEAEEAFQGARRATAVAETALAEARAGFDAQLRSILADPLAFAAQTPERRERHKRRTLARRRVKDAMKRMAAELKELRRRPPATAAEPTSSETPKALELVFRRSLGFGTTVAAPPAPVPPPAPPPPPPPAAAIDLSALESRLAAIEEKLDRALERGPASGPDAEPGLASRYGPGTRAGLRGDDPRFHEKQGILRKLLAENVKLRGEVRTIQRAAPAAKPLESVGGGR